MSKTVLFVCRGNAFRSIIAEALLRSRGLPGVLTMSAGTVANRYYAQNNATYRDTLSFLIEHDAGQFAKDHYGDQLTQELLDAADVVILLNDIVRKEAVSAGLVLPASTQVWAITDMGEPGRVPENDTQKQQYAEDVYQDIRMSVDKLVIPS